MTQFLRLGFLATVFVLSTSCSVNILENFANKNTDNARLEAAKILINNGDYSGAISKLDEITGTLASDRGTVALRASAYAGLCGLNFLNFVQAFSSTSLRFFPFLLSHFVGGTTTTAGYCLTAENLVESIGTSSARTNDENMLLLVISLAKVGNYLNAYADTNNDGSGDAGFDFCASGSLPDADTQEIGTGITLAIEALTALSGSVSLGSSSLSTINTACSSMVGGYDFCSVTDPSAFTANQIKGIRTILNEDSSVGVGTNCSGNVSACACP
ncbi:MAG: hypothetical protein AB7F86_04480 [Bdellovibrionales bacterium]